MGQIIFVIISLSAVAFLKHCAPFWLLIYSHCLKCTVATWFSKYAFSKSLMLLLIIIFMQFLSLG